MLGADGNKPTGKSDKRKRKTKQEGKKARQPKSAQPTPDQLQDEVEPISAFIAPTADAATVEAAEPLPVGDQTIANAGHDETAEQDVTAAPQQQASKPDRLQDALNAVNAAVASIESVPIAPSPADSTAVAAEAAPIAAADPTPTAGSETAPVNYQAIAKAYDNYTRHSLNQTKSFFERLAGVRSIDKAFELQTEFAKQAYDSFVSESQKIRALHNEMARQRLERWEGFVGMAKPR